MLAVDVNDGPTLSRQQHSSRTRIDLVLINYCVLQVRGALTAFLKLLPTATVQPARASLELHGVHLAANNSALPSPPTQSRKRQQHFKSKASTILVDVNNGPTLSRQTAFKLHED